MIKNLLVIASGGALAFGLAGAVSSAMASVAHPVGVTRANLPMPDGTPIIRDSTARFGDPDDGGQVAQAAARFGDPTTVARSRSSPRWAGGPAKVTGTGEHPFVGFPPPRFGSCAARHAVGQFQERRAVGRQLLLP